MGLGEFTAVLNGVNFRTRHNDYVLVQASSDNSTYGKVEEIPFPDVPPAVLNQVITFQVRSGMGAYAGAARHRVNLTTVLLRPPSGHRPDRRQARHARILQIGLHLTQP